jgi:hypothetical protein
MFTGLDIQLDFGMYEDEKETRRKAKLLKKKGGKALGGKLFKMSFTQPKTDPVKPKQIQGIKEEEQPYAPEQKISVKYQSGYDEKNDDHAQKDMGATMHQ